MILHIICLERYAQVQILGDVRERCQVAVGVNETLMTRYNEIPDTDTAQLQLIDIQCEEIAQGPEAGLSRESRF